MPEIYVSTSCLKGTKDLGNILETYRSHGIGNVELGSGLEYVEGVEAVLQKYSEMNFIVHNYFPPAKEPFVMNLAAQDDGIRGRSVEVCKGALDLCGKLGYPLYTFHPGFRVNGTLDIGFELSDQALFPYEAAFNKFCDSIGEVYAHARCLGIRIALENLEHKNDAYMMTAPWEFDRFLDLFPSVGVLLDLGHLKIAAKRRGFEEKEFLKCVRDAVVEIHIHDNDGVRDMHRALSDNRRLELLRDLGYSIVSLEYRDLTIEDILSSRRNLEIIISRP